MQFQPGNKVARGRKPGSKNRLKKTLRETISKFLEEEFDSIRATFEELKPNERAKLYCDLLQFGLPKLQAMNMELKFEDMTEKQLDEVIKKMIDQQQEHARTKLRVAHG